MKSAILSIVAILGFSCSVAHAACTEELPASTVVFQQESNDITVDHQQTSVELGKSKSTGPMWHTLGYTGFGLKYRLVRKLSAVASDDGQVCVTTQATIFLKITPEVIHVASELPEGSCSFDQVLKHEHQHVQMNQDMLEKVISDLNAKAATAFANKVWTGPRETVIPGIASELRDNWAEQALRQFEAVDAQHEALDSVDYAKNGHYCGGEMVALIQAANTSHRFMR